MNGLIQAAVEARSTTIIERPQVATVEFSLGMGADVDPRKVMRFYKELGESEDGLTGLRAVVGLGGSTAFTVKNAIGEDEVPTKIYGVILYAHDLNEYYNDEAQGEPPECVSKDGITGHNRVTGETCECSQCPRNRRSEGKKAKDCRNKKRLYILTEQQMEPMVLNIPPASLNSGWKPYQAALRMIGFRSPHEVLTEFSLERATNANKNVYSKIIMKPVGLLPKETVKTLETIRSVFKPDEIELDDFVDITEDE